MSFFIRPGIAHLFLALLLSGWTALAAQSVRWSPDGGSFAMGKAAQLSLVFEDCLPRGEIQLPRVDGLEFYESRVGFSKELLGTRSRQTQTHTFRVHPSAAAGGTITIPAFKIRTDKGELSVAAATYKITSASTTKDSVTLDEVANSHLKLPGREIWVGEVFPLEYFVALDERYSPRISSLPGTDGLPLVMENFSTTPRRGEELRNGTTFTTLGFPSRAMSTTTGSLDLSPLPFRIGLPERREHDDIFGFSLMSPAYRQYTIHSPATKLHIKPLPSSAPSSFNGAVGDFKLSSRIVPEKVSIGEPVTWTLEFSGVGNWPTITGFTEREVSLDFRLAAKPRAQKNIADGKIFEGTLTEDVVLIPQKPGHHRFGPFEISIFNPATGKYETLRAGGVVEVMPAHAGVTPSVSSVGSTPEVPTGTTTSTPDIPSMPETVPSGPLPVSDASAPDLLRPRALWGWMLGVLLCPLPTWFALAWRLALHSDPLRPRRTARRRLTRILRHLQDAPEISIPALLLTWQHETAILWNLPGAAPAAYQLPAGEWGWLWEETDRVLYHGDGARLPNEWHTRAQKALAASPRHAFRPWQVFYPANLFPFFAVVLALCTWNTPELRAATTSTPSENPDNTRAMAAYISADFKAAEALWRAHLEITPGNWGAHHNLSLALSQQDRWQEGAAHAIAAFLQNPRMLNHAHDAQIRWQLGHSLKKAGYMPASLAPILLHNWQGRMISFASPVEWQRIRIAGTVLIALAIISVLVGRYRHAFRRHTATASQTSLQRKKHLVQRGTLTLFPVLGGALAIATSIQALHSYGELADTRAALVFTPCTLHTIPTEAGDSQQKSPVPAGSLVLLKREWLGWRQVSFANGQDGWIRSIYLVPLWQ